MPSLPRSELETAFFERSDEKTQLRQLAIEDRFDEFFVTLFRPDARGGVVEDPLIRQASKNGALAIGYLRNARLFAVLSLSEPKPGSAEPEDRSGGVDGS